MKDLGPQAWQGVMSMKESTNKGKFTLERNGGRNRLIKLHNGADLRLRMRLYHQCASSFPPPPALPPPFFLFALLLPLLFLLDTIHVSKEQSLAEQIKFRPNFLESSQLLELTAGKTKTVKRSSIVIM